MKKLILWSMLLVVCSCLVLVACDSDKPDAPPTNTNAETEAKTQTEAHVHAFCDWTTAKQPTCTEQGEQTRTCACGEAETQVIDALGHTEVVDAAVESTCAKTGLTAGKHCSVCDEVLVAQEEVAALGHTEVVDAAVAPTCTATGLTEGKHCSVCNGVVVAQKQVAALGHDEVVDAAVTPSCTANGLTQGKHCSRCNKILIKQNTIAATGKHTGKGYCTGCGLNYFNELANIIIKNGYRNDYGTMVYKYYSRGDVTVSFYYTTSGNIEVNVITTNNNGTYNFYLIMSDAYGEYSYSGYTYLKSSMVTYTTHGTLFAYENSHTSTSLYVSESYREHLLTGSKYSLTSSELASCKNLDGDALKLTLKTMNELLSEKSDIDITHLGFKK